MTATSTNSRRRTVARPIPLAPPVTMATLLTRRSWRRRISFGQPARDGRRSRRTALDYRSQLIAVRWVGMDADRDETSVVGSLAPRHNQRRRALRLQRRGEALVQGLGAHDLLGLVRSRLGGGEVAAQDDIETPTPGRQEVLAPAQWTLTLATITSHPWTLREVPLRTTGHAEAGRQCGVGDDVPDLRVQDPRALDQRDDVVGRAGDGLVVIDRRQSNDTAAVARDGG